MNILFKSILLILTCLLPLGACADDGQLVGLDTEKNGSRTVVIYFSCTNTTESVANQIAEILNASTWEIEAKVPYTADDLKYYTNCRADQEQNDPSARPELKENFAEVDQYDVIYLGYPIWHGQAPKIIYTFLESHNLEGKTIFPFCTSHSSGIGTSDTNLHSSAPEAVWKSGKRFGSGASRSEIESWVSSVHPIAALNSIKTDNLFDNGNSNNSNSDKGAQTQTLRIFDLKGHIVKNDIDALQRGVYILESVKEDGSVNVSKIIR